MADVWREVADERHVIVTRAHLWRWDHSRKILVRILGMLTTVACFIAAYDFEAPSPLGLALVAVFGIPLAAVVSWRIRFEVSPREVIRYSGPLAFLTRNSVPLSEFRSVVCDYDRILEDDTRYVTADDDGPHAIVIQYSYRVTLEGESRSWRLGAFQSAQEAERLALTLASRFGLKLIDLQDHPSVDLVREAEHIGSWILMREAD